MHYFTALSGRLRNCIKKNRIGITKLFFLLLRWVTKIVVIVVVVEVEVEVVIVVVEVVIVVVEVN